MSTAASKKEWLRNKMYSKYGVNDTPNNFDSEFTVAENIMKNWGQNVIDALKLNLNSLNKKASSDLIQSIAFDVQDHGSYVQLKLLASPHYIFVNDGRRGDKMKWTDNNELMLGKRKSSAKLPPFDAISNWVRFKGVKALSKSGLGFRTRQTSRVADKVKKMQLVELIRRKIKRDGIEPTYFYTQVVNKQTIEDLTSLLLRESGKQLVVNFKKVLEK